MGFFDEPARRGAVFDAHRAYRYILWRIWHASKPRALVIGLNPSMADEERDDPTMRRIRMLLSDLGYGSFVMTNLYDLITPYPRELVKHPLPHGPKHWREIEHEIKNCAIAVAAWGAHPLTRHEAPKMLSFLRRHGMPVMCFGTTKEGLPKHPLYLANGTQLIPYEVDVDVTGENDDRTNR
jgi:hypothetical protein